RPNRRRVPTSTSADAPGRAVSPPEGVPPPRRRHRTQHAHRPEDWRMSQSFVFRTIILDTQTLRTAVRPGSSHLPPLLICNGIGANLELVLPFVNALPADLEVIAFDVPGVGGSSTPLLPYRFGGLARLMARMLDYLNYGQVNVIGVSWGGALAQQFAHDFPERCKKLVLAATSAGAFMVPGKPKVLLRMASPRRYLQPSYGSKIAPHI